ncbi:hypothetical protein L208DRAFT_1377514 [Tricholoma matsutake]|nr:hypothetical protein L208DRAFT_1377514 [Tricholoma matsutake 945]
MKFLHLALANLLGVVFVHAAPNLNPSPTVTLDPSPTSICTQPPTSTKTTDWSNDTYIEQNMAIPLNSTAIFWMGRVPNSNQSVERYAVDCAKREGGVTIGMVMCQNGFTGPPLPPGRADDPEAADKWNHRVSRVYAEKTKGVAWTIAGNFTSTSDYLADEFPALINNTEVKAVLGIDPETCTPSCYWYCPRNSGVAQCNTLKFCYFEGPWPYYTQTFT